MVYGVIYICPECRHTLMYKTEDDNTVILINRICVEDGYTMRPFIVNSELVDQLLKGEVNKCHD